MSITIKIKNGEIQKINKYLGKMGEKVQENGRETNKKFGKKIMNEAIKTVPVDTRNLKKSIAIKSCNGGETVTIFIRSTASYGVHVHEGHWTRSDASGKYKYYKPKPKHWIEGRPFMVDALNKYKDEYLSTMDDIVKNI